MAYIEAHQSLRDHRKILALAAELNMLEPHVGGHCLWLWLWSLDNAEEGRLPDSVRIIERAAGWQGESGALVAAMIKVNMLDQGDDGAIYIHDWWDYAGRLIEKRKSDAERKRVARAQPAPSVGHPTDGAGTSNGRRADGAGTVPNRTLPYPTQPSSSERETSAAAATHAHARQRAAETVRDALAAQPIQSGDSGGALILETEATLARWRTLTKKRRASLPSPDALHSVLQRHHQRGMTAEVLHCEILKLEDEAATAARPLTLTRLDNWLNQWHAPPLDAPARIGNGRHSSPVRPEPPTRISASQANQWWVTPTADSPPPATRTAAPAAPAAQVSPDTSADDCVADALRSPPVPCIMDQALVLAPGQARPALQVIAAR